MKISYNWLKNYLPISLSPEVVSAMLTDCGLEVEGMEKFQSVKGGLEGLVIGEVLTCVQHSNADKLKVTTVNVGNGNPLQIVCGGPNVAAGQKVVVALPGTILYPVAGEPFEIKKSKIRGEASEGMICAEDEIGLGTSHAGVIVLPADAVTGMHAKDFYKIEDDVIFEIGLTPNRADAASHIGVARDLFAVLQQQPAHLTRPDSIDIPSVDNFKTDNTSLPVTVDVQDTDACPRYSGISISGVTVGESPDWLKSRLKSIGVGPINNIVDITNFVLHECGQPLHAFDADEISGKKVIVRSAIPGEKFVTLDSVERKLSAGNLMICNANDPMCIAGVFGGIRSGISNKTKNIFLESAYFSPASIRKTSKEHGLKTDASFRFERGTDPELTLYALKRASLLIREMGGGKISSDIVDVYPVKIQPAVIHLRYTTVDQLVGEVIDRSTIKQILRSLGILISKEEKESLQLTLPTHKTDVTREVDVVEEILRIYGYNKIGISSKLFSSLPSFSGIHAERIQQVISDYLCSTGFTEIMTNSITRSKYNEVVAPGSGSVKIINPLSQDLDVMRQSLLYSGLETIAYNRNRKQNDLKFFEFGKTYHKKENGFKEVNHLTFFITGKKYQASWNGDKKPADFFYLKSFVKNILVRLGINGGLHPLAEIPFHDEVITSGLEIKSNTNVLVQYGAVKKVHLKNADISADVWIADFNWDTILKMISAKDTRHEDVSKFPQVRRDLSMLISKDVSYAAIEEIAYKTEKNLLKEIHLFDVYEGEKIEAGKKSYAVTFILEDERQTLTDKQIDKIMNRMMEAFEKQAGAVIRKQ